MTRLQEKVQCEHLTDAQIRSLLPIQSEITKMFNHINVLVFEAYDVVGLENMPDCKLYHEIAESHGGEEHPLLGHLDDHFRDLAKPAKIEEVRELMERYRITAADL